MNIYANVRLTSKYSNQRQSHPFPVELSSEPADFAQGFNWNGGPGHRYGTSDLEFLAKTGAGFQPINMLTGFEPHLLNQVADSALGATNPHYLAMMLVTLKGATERLQAAYKASLIEEQKRIEEQNRWGQKNGY